MESLDPKPDAKYQKLAQEYSKLRVQASVLKKAVIEEQNKSSCLREAMRLKEVELRRSEQEVDSLSFRNKQLEHRCSTLQDDLERQQLQGKQKTKATATTTTTTGSGNVINNNNPNDNHFSVVADEFQKKIIENAQLQSLVADRERELELCQKRLRQMEDQVNGQIGQQGFLEDQLRQEIHQLCLKNSDLELKLMEAGRAATNSEEDGVSESSPSDSGSGATEPVVSISVGDRLINLERELRSKYELLRLNGGQEEPAAAAAAATDRQTGIAATAAEQSQAILLEHLGKKIEDMFLEKSLADSKSVSYLTECDNLRDQLTVIMDELRDRDRQLAVVRDQLQTTTHNYEEQICVLTEQVISLSDQLAASSH